MFPPFIHVICSCCFVPFPRLSPHTEFPSLLPLDCHFCPFYPQRLLGVSFNWLKMLPREL